MKYILLLLLLSGCDATIGKLTSIGSAADIVCYSGGKLILETESTGKVISENGSGYYFKDKKDNRMTEVDAACIIKYK
tara:strand:+ start:9638 stop:9871 length:234 start_codon:yes stop_codon:yes gene_type:complete